LAAPEPGWQTVPHPTFREALRFWLKLGFVNFGGPTGQIAIMHRELVERRRWISEARFLHALNFCMLLPGPEAQQLAIYVGWLLHRARGGLAAGTLFVLPSVFVLLALSWVYVTYGTVPAVAGLFFGLKATVLAVVAHAVLRIGRRAVRTAALALVAALAFGGTVLGVPFPALVVGAGLAGLLGYRAAPRWFAPAPEAGGEEAGAVLGTRDPTPPHALPHRGRALRTLALGLLLWLPLLGGLWLLRGTAPVLSDVALFFSQAALVTFGGAYAVLSYVTQASVQHYHWLLPTQMLDGLGLAETTPGPLIMVVQFVGFLAGFHQPGTLPPLVAAVAAAVVATYVTFLPSFLFIFLGAPHVERLRGHEELRAALGAITAAVVGVILQLALFFGEHVVLAGGQVLWLPLGIAAAAFAALAVLEAGVVPVILAGGMLGLALRLLGLVSP
jgi:chromate transporter